MIKNENVIESTTLKNDQTLEAIDHSVEAMKRIVVEGFVEGGATLFELDQFRVLAERLYRVSLQSEAGAHWQHDAEVAATTIVKLLTSVKSLALMAYQINESTASEGDSQRDLLAHLLLTRDSFVNWFNSKRIDVESEIPFVFSRDSEFPELRESGAYPTPLRPESDDPENASGQNGQPANNENASQTSER